MFRHVLLGSAYPKRRSEESVSQSNHDSTAISKSKSSGIGESCFESNNPRKANLQQNDRLDSVEGMDSGSASDEHCGDGGSRANATISIPSHTLIRSATKPNEVNNDKLSPVLTASKEGGGKKEAAKLNACYRINNGMSAVEAAQKNKTFECVGRAARLYAEKSTNNRCTGGSNRQFHNENFEGGAAKSYGPTNTQRTFNPGQVSNYPPLECRGSEVSAEDLSWVDSWVDSLFATTGDAQNQFNHFLGNGHVSVPVPPACPLDPRVPDLQSYPWVPLLPPMAMDATLSPMASSNIGDPRQGVGTFVPSPAQVTMPTQQPSTAANISNVVSNECCARNLRPAPLPRNPVDDEWEKSTPLEKEIAWLLEESDVIMPSQRNDDASQNKPLLPLLLDYAWKHGTLQLREMMLEIFPSKIRSLLTKLNNEGISGHGNDVAGGSDVLQLGLVDGQELILPRNGNKTNLSSENISQLRKEARHALRLGFRRSESIERELNTIKGLRWRDAVEEVGDPGADKYWTAKPKPSQHRRKRLKNEALFKRALGQDRDRVRDRDSPSHSQLERELETIATRVPSELTPLEDEVAWLVEESLILLPDDMINDNSKKQTESYMTAGLVTNSADIKWDFVEENASEALKEHFKSKGGIKRRPLQRIIRYTNTATRYEFHQRRDQIASLLLLHGYRRNETKNLLPSQELLVQTGLDKVWAVRLMRRKQNMASKDAVSSKDLRSACNARICGKEPSAQTPQRPNEQRRRGRPPKASLNRPAATQKTKPQPSGPIARLSVTEKDPTTAYFEKFQPPAMEVRLAATQYDHAAAALSDEPQPPEPAVRIAVAKNNHECHTADHTPSKKRRKKLSLYRGISVKKGPNKYFVRVANYGMGCYKFEADAALAYDIGIKRVKGSTWKPVNFASRKDYERVVRAEMEKTGCSANAEESFEAVLAKAEGYMAKYFPKKVSTSEDHDKEERESFEKSQPPAPEVRFAVTQHDHAEAALLEKPKSQEPAVRIAIAKSKLIAAESSKKSQTPVPTQKAAAQSDKLAVTQKAQSSILTSGEEEIAWLREEYEFETGVNRYNWEYIEQHSSLPLLIQLAERRCAPSGFPSVAGASRLREMVRFDDPRVVIAFDAKRRDIRHAITVLGHRRDRSRHLPDVPPAPASFGRPVARRNGASVIDVEYACDVGGTGGIKNEIICIDDGSDNEANREDPSEKIGTLRNGRDASSTGKKERSNACSKESDRAKTKEKADALLSKCYSSESCSEQSEDKVTDNSSGDESGDELEEDDSDEEYEVSSEEESEDDYG